MALEKGAESTLLHRDWSMRLDAAVVAAGFARGFAGFERGRDVLLQRLMEQKAGFPISRNRKRALIGALEVRPKATAKCKHIVLSISEYQVPIRGLYA